MAGEVVRIGQLETELTQIKVDIKEILVELKVLAMQDHNPLADQTTARHRPAQDRPIILVSSRVGSPSDVRLTGHSVSHKGT